MKKLLLAVVAVLALGSCSTSDTAVKDLYSWYDYEDAAYEYGKKNTDEKQAKLLEQYKKLVENQKALRGVVPPGMYAEYGYLLYKCGKKDEGLGFMKQEISIYPESEKYISRIIKQLEK